MFRRKRKHAEVEASIARLERENDALDAQIEVAAAPLPPKKRADWKEGGPAVLLPNRTQMIALGYIDTKYGQAARSLSAHGPMPRRPEDFEFGPRVQWLVDDPRSITVLR